MLPIPTSTARLAFLGASACLVLATLLGSFPAFLVGAGMLLALALVFALSVPIGRRVRSERLEFAWWFAHGDPSIDAGAAVPKKPFEVRCFLQHRGAGELRLDGLLPIVTDGVRVVDDPGGVLVVPPGSRTEFSFRLAAPATGRVVLSGLTMRLVGPLDLFEMPLYFPNPLSIKVLPRAALSMRGVLRSRAGLPMERAGASVLAKGGGTELRELRDMQPGDSFHSIAWRPSARRGKLLVREVEQEVQEARYLVLDVSGTMRAGDPGDRKLDYGIEAVAAEARRTLARGDRLGLVTMDGRVLSHVPLGDGAAQLFLALDALIAATEVVDVDLTEVDDDDVAVIVGRYVNRQDGLDCRLPDGSWDVAALVKHASSALSGASSARARARLAHRGEVHAASPTGAILRRFCLARGILLPHRFDLRGGAKVAGFAGVLHAIAGTSRARMSIALVTDLDGLGDPAPLAQTMKLLATKGHALVVFALDATRFHPRPERGLPRTLWDVYERGESRRLRELRALVAPWGVRVVAADPSVPAAMALSRAVEGARRGAA